MKFSLHVALILALQTATWTVAYGQEQAPSSTSPVVEQVPAIAAPVPSVTEQVAVAPVAPAEEVRKLVGMYVDGGLGFSYAGASYGIGGGSYNLGVGIKLWRFALGGVYQGSLGVTGDYGLLGGGIFASDWLGGKVDFDLLSSDNFQLRIGGMIGRMWGAGIRAVMLMPYAADDVSALSAGPLLSFMVNVNRYLAMGAQADYLVNVPFSMKTNGEISSLATFGSFDLGFKMEIRLLPQ